MTQIERALSHVSSLDELARRDTPVGRIDARAKVLVVFGFLVTVASYGRHDIVAPLALLVFLAAGMALGDVPWRIVLTRLAIASPFAILVGIWNPIFEPRPLLHIGPWVLSAGWVSCFGVIERFVLAVTAVLVLIATTGLDAVAAALGRLGMPRVLVTQLLLLYRYWFLLGAEMSRMLRAHALRVPDHPRPTLHTMRSLLGELLVRSLARAERVHIAMLCRGFDGEIRRKAPMLLGPGDVVFVVISAGFFVLVRAIDVPRWLASIVT
jgi:cobalt/nickel transport system permease protein